MTVPRFEDAHPANGSGGLFLGRSFEALDNEKSPKFLGDMDDFFALCALKWFAPWMLAILHLLPLEKIQHFLGAMTRSYQYGRDAFQEYVQQNGRHSGRVDLLTKMLGTVESKPMTDDAISDELGSLLVGATDTTVVVATWLVWELANRPDWQVKIRNELRKNKVEFKDGISQYRDIKSLPVLNGFVMESMRLHPAQSIGLPRVAQNSETSIGGIKVPAGVRFAHTLISSQPTD